MIKTNKQYIPSFILALLSTLAFISAIIYILSQPLNSNILDYWSSLLSILSIASLSVLFILKKERPLFIFILLFSIPILLNIYARVAHIIDIANNVTYTLDFSFIGSSILPLVLLSILTLVFLLIYSFSKKQCISAIVLLSVMLSFLFHSQIVNISNLSIQLLYLTVLNILSDIFLYSAMILFVVLSKKNSFSK